MYFQVIANNLPYFLGGLVTTVEVSALGAAGGLLIGTMSAAARLSAVAVFRSVFTAYVEVFRNTPLLVQALILFFGPAELGYRIDGFQTLALCLALNSGAYLSEIIRGGLQSVPRGQLEAAASVGLGSRTTLLEIILPQAARIVYPAISNQLISVVLASSIGTIIGAAELTNRVLEEISVTYRTTELLLFLTVSYAVLAYVIGMATRLVGARLDRAYAR